MLFYVVVASLAFTSERFQTLAEKARKSASKLRAASEPCLQPGRYDRGLIHFEIDAPLCSEDAAEIRGMAHDDGFAAILSSDKMTVQEETVVTDIKQQRLYRIGEMVDSEDDVEIYEVKPIDPRKFFKDLEIVTAFDASGASVQSDIGELLTNCVRDGATGDGWSTGYCSTKMAIGMNETASEPVMYEIGPTYPGAVAGMGHNAELTYYFAVAFTKKKFRVEMKLDIVSRSTVLFRFPRNKLDTTVNLWNASLRPINNNMLPTGNVQGLSVSLDFLLTASADLDLHVDIPYQIDYLYEWDWSRMVSGEFSVAKKPHFSMITTGIPHWATVRETWDVKEDPNAAISNVKLDFTPRQSVKLTADVQLGNEHLLTEGGIAIEAKGDYSLSEECSFPYLSGGISLYVEHFFNFDIQKTVTTLVETFAKTVRNWLKGLLNEYGWVLDLLVSAADQAMYTFGVTDKINEMFTAWQAMLDATTNQRYRLGNHTKTCMALSSDGGWPATNYDQQYPLFMLRLAKTVTEVPCSLFVRFYSSQSDYEQKHPIDSRYHPLVTVLSDGKLAESVVMAQVPPTAVFTIVGEKGNGFTEDFPTLGGSHPVGDANNIQYCGDIDGKRVCLDVEHYHASAVGFNREFHLMTETGNSVATFPSGILESNINYCTLFKGSEGDFNLYDSDLQLFDSGMSSVAEFINGPIYTRRTAASLSFSIFKFPPATEKERKIHVTMMKQAQNAQITPISRKVFVLPAEVHTTAPTDSYFPVWNMEINYQNYNALICVVDVYDEQGTKVKTSTMNVKIEGSIPNNVEFTDGKITAGFTTTPGAPIPGFIRKSAAPQKSQLLAGDGTSGQATESLQGLGCATFVESGSTVHAITDTDITIQASLKAQESYGTIIVYFKPQQQIADTLLQENSPLRLSMLLSMTNGSPVGAATILGTGSEFVIPITSNALSKPNVAGATISVSIPFMRKGPTASTPIDVSVTIKKLFFSQGQGTCTFKTDIQVVLIGGTAPSMVVGCVEMLQGTAADDQWIASYEILTGWSPETTVEPVTPVTSGSNWALRSFTVTTTAESEKSGGVIRPRPATINLAPDQFSVTLRSRDILVYREYYEKNKGATPMSIRCQRCDSISVKYSHNSQTAAWRLTNKQGDSFSLVPPSTGSITLEAECNDVTSAYCRIEDKRSDTKNTYVVVYGSSDGITDLRTQSDIAPMQEGVLMQVLTGNVFQYWKKWTGKVSYIKLDSHGLDIVYQVHYNDTTTIQAFIGNQPVPFSPSKIGSWIQSDGQTKGTSDEETFKKALELIGLKQDEVNRDYYLDYEYIPSTGVILVNNSLVKYNLGKKRNHEGAAILIDVPSDYFKDSVTLRCSKAHTKTEKGMCVYGFGLSNTIWWIVLLIILAIILAIVFIIVSIIAKYKPGMIFTKANKANDIGCCQCGACTCRCRRDRCSCCPCDRTFKQWKCDTDETNIEGEAKSPTCSCRKCCSCSCLCYPERYDVLNEANEHCDSCQCGPCHCFCWKMKHCTCCCWMRKATVKGHQPQAGDANNPADTEIRYYNSCTCRNTSCFCCMPRIAPNQNQDLDNLDQNDANAGANANANAGAGAEQP